MQNVRSGKRKSQATTFSSHQKEIRIVPPARDDDHRAASGPEAGPRAEESSSTCVPQSPAKKPACSMKACEGVRRSESLAGLVVVTVMLFMLAVGGRAFAVMCTSGFFYLRSYLKGSRVEKGGDAAEKKPMMMEVDYESEEYRKKVLMEGLLRRDGRR